MVQIFSIKEIVRASDKILDDDYENLKTKKISTKKEEDFSQPLLLVNAISENTINKSKSSFLDKLVPENINFKSNYKIKDAFKNALVQEFYIFFKKKIKKNTLKLIFDQQLQIEIFKKKINYLNKYNTTVATKNVDLLTSLKKIIEDKENLEAKNIDLLSNLNKIKNDKKTFENKNIDLLYNLDKISLDKKNLMGKFAQNNHNYEKATELKNKLIFTQNENLRLSNELFILNKKNKDAEIKLSNFDIQKNQISDQIKELNSSLNTSNLISSSFDKGISNEIVNDISDKISNNTSDQILNNTSDPIFKNVTNDASNKTSKNFKNKIEFRSLDQSVKKIFNKKSR